MGLNQERDQLKKANPDKKWEEEVDKMRDAEVVAAYYRLKVQGRFGK